jgi:alpha/beta superfamily hydrolase
VVVEFIGCSFGGHVSALIERFIEDTWAVEGAAVVAGWDAGALFSSISTFLFQSDGGRTDSPSAYTSYKPSKP